MFQRLSLPIMAVMFRKRMDQLFILLANEAWKGQKFQSGTVTLARFHQRGRAITETIRHVHELANGKNFGSKESINWRTFGGTN